MPGDCRAPFLDKMFGFLPFFPIPVVRQQYPPLSDAQEKLTCMLCFTSLRLCVNIS